MRSNTKHTCLDCEYTGRLHHESGIAQCPQCGSRAVWPVSPWSEPDIEEISSPKKRGLQLPERCDITPTFFGGPFGYQQ